MRIDNFASTVHFQTLDASADATIKVIQLVTGPQRKALVVYGHTLLHDDNINPNFPERTE